MRSPRTVLAPTLAAVALAFSLASLGCATYRQDLDRARAHYEANEYEKALALFRVLEPDMDSFSDAEKTQFAYFRGMTDYRIAGLANPGEGVSNPKQDFGSNARHWLAVASAIEKQAQGGLAVDEKQRLADAMVDLNKDVYGGADASEGDAAKAGDKAAKTAPGGNEKPDAKPESTKKP
jgi:hypothetical protein